MRLWNMKKIIIIYGGISLRKILIKKIEIVKELQDY